MSTKNDARALPKDMANLLKHIEHHGTPWCIAGSKETYFVLSAGQLITLLCGMVEEATAVTSFTPEDFGLTETEISAYITQRQSQREHLGHNAPVPLNVVLEQHLHQWTQLHSQQPLSDEQKHMFEQLLQELDSALIDNVQRVARKTK